MGKFDKKILKYVAARQEDDLDADDIAIGLHLDEDDVRETLDLLKNQGKIEESPRNGKTYWRLLIQESEPVEETKKLSVQISPDVIAIDLDQAIDNQMMKPILQKIEPDEIEKNPVTSTLTVSSPKMNILDINKLDDDTDMDMRPKLVDSAVVRIVLTVILSVVISSIISIIAVSGSQKELADNIQELNSKSTATNAKLDKRVAEISAQLSILNEKIPGRQFLKTDQNSARAQHKKKIVTKPLSSPDENAKSEPSGIDQSSQTPSSGHDENPVPAQTPPSPPEGTGENSQ
jgi:hypothetical protein